MARLNTMQIKLKYSSRIRIGILVVKILNKILPLEISVEQV